MITNYLPKFKVFEVNNLTGLRSGHMLSQIKADAGLAMKSVGEAKFIENGLIVGLGKDGTVINYSEANCGQIFVHYTEELNTFLPDLQYYALPVEADGTAYPRCIALYVGDSFTTNNYVGTYKGVVAAKVVDGVLNLQSAVDADSLFLAVPGYMPDGSEGVEFTYCGHIVQG